MPNFGRSTLFINGPFEAGVKMMNNEQVSRICQYVPVQ